MRTMKLVCGITVLALMAPAAAEAQCAGGAARVPALGISLVQCDCTISSSNPSAWRFRTPPQVFDIVEGSAAASVLREGDVIMQVNGRAITTAEGAAAFARIREGGSATLLIQRDGRTQTVALRRSEVCPRQAALIAIAPSVDLARLRPTPAGRATTVAPAAVAGASGGGRSVPLIASTVSPSATAAYGVALAPTVALSTGWIGIAFSCTDCTVDHQNQRWIFRSAPEVYSVEGGSPAYAAGLRRGDVLTHVDGVSITTEDGGRRWAQVKPAQSVRVNYQRGGQVRVATIVAGSQRLLPSRAQGARTAYRAGADSATLSRALLEYERMLQQQGEREAQVLRRMLETEAVRDTAARRHYEQVLREYNEQQVFSERERARRSEELLRRYYEQQTVLDVRPSVTVPLMATAAEQRLRFSGTLGGTEVEVRGLNSVVVTENGDELIITTSDATIRLKKSR